MANAKKRRPPIEVQQESVAKDQKKKFYKRLGMKPPGSGSSKKKSGPSLAAGDSTKPTPTQDAGFMSSVKRVLGMGGTVQAGENRVDAAVKKAEKGG